MEIKALARIDNKTITCRGKIDIHWINEPQAYVTWVLLNENGNLIASKSENFYYLKDKESKNELIRRVLEKIENYRIGRKKIFDKVQLCDS